MLYIMTASGWRLIDGTQLSATAPVEVPEPQYAALQGHYDNDEAAAIKARRLAYTKQQRDTLLAARAAAYAKRKAKLETPATATVEWTVERTDKHTNQTTTLPTGGMVSFPDMFAMFVTDTQWLNRQELDSWAYYERVVGKITL